MATIKIADRVKETTTTTGTGTVDLGGAVQGFQTFVAGIGTGNACYYAIVGPAEWEVGIGTVTDATPDTLSRTTVLSSSNSNSLVSLSSGSKDVFCTIPASIGSQLFPLTPPPPDGTWSWLNQGGATTTQCSNGIFLTGPVTATNVRARTRSMGSFTTLTSGQLPAIFNTSTQVGHAGVVLRESGTGKLVTFSAIQGTSGPSLFVIRWSSPTASGTVDLSTSLLVPTSPLFLKVDTSGSNIAYSYGPDNENWIVTFNSVGKTTQFTAGPNEWGFCIIAGGGTGGLGTKLISWTEA